MILLLVVFQMFNLLYKCSLLHAVTIDIVFGCLQRSESFSYLPCSFLRNHKDHLSEQERLCSSAFVVFCFGSEYFRPSESN